MMPAPMPVAIPKLNAVKGVVCWLHESTVHFTKKHTSDLCVVSVLVMHTKVYTSHPSFSVLFFAHTFTCLSYLFV